MSFNAKDAFISINGRKIIPMNEAEMFRLLITIKGLPKMANGGHGSWKADAAAKKKWKMAMARELIGLQPIRPFEKIRVTFTRCSAVEPDLDGMVHGFKPVRDALVKFGFVVDDKNKNMEATYLWEKAPRGQGFIRIELKGVS